MNDKRVPNDPKPEFVTDEHLRFLDALRADGKINMLGAAAPLREIYPELSKQQAREAHSYWMRSFAERHTPKAVAKIYSGIRRRDGAKVYVGDKPLRVRLDLFNHSPDGFEWGYGGSGPAQLALAILADYLGDDERAVRLHQDFKREVIAPIQTDMFNLTGEAVATAIDLIERLHATDRNEVQP